jgi:5-methyltetrahydrofolate--homocysteine methyltransferase
MKSLNEELKNKIVIIDGATGTMLQAQNLFTDILSIESPNSVAHLHENYIKAGAQIIKTNTFNSNLISLKNSPYKNQIEVLNIQSIQIAKDMAQKHDQPKNPIFVAGVIGPTPISLSKYPIELTDFKKAIFQQVEIFNEKKIDLFLIETVYDLKNLTTTLEIIRQISNIPIMVSLTVNKECTHINTGESLREIINELQKYKIFSMGINCSFGPDHLEKTLDFLHQNLNIPLSLHPNAGLPDFNGKYSYSPEIFAEKIEKYLKLGFINMIGGCCGTTPLHIKKLHELSKKYHPRKLT